MKALTKLLAMLAIIAISQSITIATCIWGWGLEPKSWLAIIGLGFFANGFVFTIGRKIMDQK